MDILNNSYFMFFLIIALGLILGNIKIRGISLDVSAVIFVAMAFGHFGFIVSPIIQKIGLILFIYSVGIQAGPGFFGSIKKQGKDYLLLAAVVVFSGAFTAFLSSVIFDIDIPLVTGMFTGALTSTPGLASAIEATGSHLASIGYGIAYPFGVIGVILFVRIAPQIFRTNITEQEKLYNDNLQDDFPQVFNRNYIIQNPNIFHKTLGELNIRTMTGCNISRILQNGIASTPTKDTIFNEGDIIKAVGTEKNLEKVRLLVGEETDKKIALSNKFFVKNVLVSNKKLVNKSFAQIDLLTNYSATATRIRRSGIDIAAKANTKIQLGDKIYIACPENNLKDIIELFGDSRSKLSQLDLLPISIGVIVGILIGMIQIPIFGFDFSFGLTGGVLLSALFLSKIGRTGPIIWNISGEINQFLRKIGLVFFLIAVGANAGSSFIETISENGIQLFLVSAVITIVPMIFTMIIGRYVMKMNFLSLLGALTGGMTSTPALSAIDAMTECDAPKISYATIYPFALVFVIIASQILGIFA